MRLLALAAAALVALPAAAQANGDAAGAPAAVAPAPPDPALVGEWRLLKVEDPGAIGRFGGEIEAMTCAFEADGQAEVRLAVMQDRDVHEHDRTFAFTTEDGAIVRDGGPPVRYEVLGGDLLVLRDPAGLVVHLVRVGG